MELSPLFYHWFVRPDFLNNLYIKGVLGRYFNFTDQKVLDFGSGIGSASSLCSKNHYIGVDPDSRRIAYAKCLNPGYNFLVLEGTNLPLKDNSVDYILTLSVLHHIASEDFLPYLSEFQRILKPYGKVVVLEPCLLKNSFFSNYVMKLCDNGSFIRDYDSYIKMFELKDFKTEFLTQFKKVLYNEILFTATIA
ncbi:class I SAM-dependent methyltransferase [Desulfosporosinus nitroreducens]|uniref:class I SAM-dependent methyltransferase n=1 Tax=Desulfosporosinus nitroreducens TaxID=2018668 RepID=UPI00207CF269|nr:class I SAM-dependent methyltransferase [Desulfosporosinus nitroreducens]MCO1601959.1 class I SAM-dependent methyltransferase [Desulfosporosinus nitroreducens]